MSRKAKPKPHSVKQKRSSVLSRILIIVWLLVVVIAILLIKEAPLAEILSGIGADSLIARNQDVVEISNLGTPASAQMDVAETAGQSPASLFKSAIANGKPTLVFFHSDNCDSCVQMINIVNEVFPEYSTQIVLVDVNVYDPQSDILIHREGINFIPTLVFYDRMGERQVFVGVMQHQELRVKLAEISQESQP